MALDVDTVCPESHVLKKISAAKLQTAKPVAADRDALRAQALLDVLEALKNRTPPVYDTDLSVPAELADAVAYRFCHLACRDARAVMGDSWDALSADYAREYKAAVSRNFSVSSNQSGPSGWTFALERR
jgi:hypothetical protein